MTGEPGEAQARRLEPPPARPAPVATENGMFGEPEPYVDPYAVYDGGWRPALARVLAVLLVVAAGLWLAALSLAQATSEEVALPAQQRGLLVLTELDALLALQLDEVQAQVNAGADVLTLPGYPVPGAEVSAADVLDGASNLELAAFRAALLAAGAAALYERGTDALRATEADADATPTLGTGGVIRTVIDALTRSRHDTVSTLVWPLALAALVLAGLVLLLGTGAGRFTHLGVALAAAGALTVLGALLLRAALEVLAPGADDPVLAAYTSIVGTLTELPLRNGAWLAASGVVVGIGGWVAGRG